MEDSPYSLHQLQCDLETNGVPDNWSYMPKDSVIEFKLTEMSGLDTRIHCIVYQDLDIAVQSTDRKKFLLLVDKITDYRTFKANLEQISLIQICAGTGLLDDDHSRSADCYVIVTPDQSCRTNHSPYQRCYPCRGLRARITRNQQLREKYKSEKNEEKKKNYSDDQPERTIEEKIKELEFEMASAQQEYAEFWQKALENGIHEVENFSVELTD